MQLGNWYNETYETTSVVPVTLTLLLGRGLVHTPLNFGLLKRFRSPLLRVKIDMASALAHPSRVECVGLRLKSHVAGKPPGPCQVWKVGASG